jgi:hypothetical protein
MSRLECKCAVAWFVTLCVCEDICDLSDFARGHGQKAEGKSLLFA